MGANFHIITNNPLVCEKYPKLALMLECGVEGVFLAGRDEIHLGAVAINHPLSGWFIATAPRWISSRPARKTPSTPHSSSNVSFGYFSRTSGLFVRM